ncbi:hypothetical protein GYMLUDRAFT_1017211 [Collybiopsis luxurians FD-317 M1]|uniref:Mid2 domain-containing protein n=1 Tax=Collybiopsis luxurians FD-317 M1 TaxID=944289 RepID=A0A0D0C0K9_9AGAR|nr:hypothetical protein GYMLUDRAFT_1017211 [Collybiopsis luxurians FD-317 M1]
MVTSNLGLSIVSGIPTALGPFPFESSSLSANEVSIPTTPSLTDSVTSTALPIASSTSTTFISSLLLTSSSSTIANPDASSPSSSTFPTLSTLSSSTSTSNLIGAASTTSSTPLATLGIAQLTILSTGSDGQTFTTVIESLPAASSSFNTNSVGSSSKSNTSEIVGGVVGGIGGLVFILAAVIYMLRRQRRREHEMFDGNFDPDRVIRASGDGVGRARDSFTDTDEIGGYGYTYAGGEKGR